VVLLISVCQVVRITGMNHRCLASGLVSFISISISNLYLYLYSYSYISPFVGRGNNLIKQCNNIKENLEKRWAILYLIIPTCLFEYLYSPLESFVAGFA
jgi:hypothetical protein